MSPDLPSPDPDNAVDPRDERFSALLDGEEPPTDTGPEPQSEAASARAAALASARDLLAVGPPPLDDHTRRRLLRGAVAAHSPAHRDRAWIARLAFAAAALAIVVASGIGIAHLGDSGSGQAGSNAKTSRSTEAAPANALAGLLDLNEISSPAVLRSRVLAALASTSATTGASPDATTTVGTSSSVPSPTADTTGTPCLGSVHAPTGTTPAAFARGTYHGATAIVFVARDGSRVYVYVLAAADCQLLTTQFVEQ